MPTLCQHGCHDLLPSVLRAKVCQNSLCVRSQTGFNISSAPPFLSSLFSPIHLPEVQPGLRRPKQENALSPVSCLISPSANDLTEHINPLHILLILIHPYTTPGEHILHILDFTLYKYIFYIVYSAVQVSSRRIIFLPILFFTPIFWVL